MAPGDLQEVLSVLRRPAMSAETARNLMVGLGAADDAAVYRISDDLALVETVDFFPPVVDDAWTWGAVAATNAMSDVYAMGGEVMFALAVAGFPRDMDKAIIAEVFRGGAEKVAEAGGVIAGGHTVVDNEPKYGLCVTGRVHPDRVLIKGGLRARDRGVLFHPLGAPPRPPARPPGGGARGGAPLRGGDEPPPPVSGKRVRRAARDRRRRSRRARVAADGSRDVRRAALLGAARASRRCARRVPGGGRRGVGDRRGARGARAAAARLGARLVRVAGRLHERDETFLQFDGDRGIGQAAGHGDRLTVRIDEGHTGLTPVDVPLEQLAQMVGEGSVEVITEQLGDLPALDLGRAARTALTHCPPL